MWGKKRLNFSKGGTSLPATFKKGKSSTVVERGKGEKISIPIGKERTNKTDSNEKRRERKGGLCQPFSQGERKKGRSTFVSLNGWGGEKEQSFHAE